MSLIIEHIYLSPVTISRDRTFFETKKISHVLIAAKSLRQHFKEITYKQLNLSDNPTTFIAKYFTEGIKFIHEAVSSQKNILVHCMGGISRSTTMVIAYLMFMLDLPFDKAYEFVKKQHPKTKPNPGFQAQLRLFEKCIAEYRLRVSTDLNGEVEIDYKLLETLIYEHIQHKFMKIKTSPSVSKVPVKHL